ncbi:hypothetical protein Taro_051803 [Colocasia esculenta]|uniref:Uncharacterized protein n=1 Tax=Colocasia esculenta TaxID=4460 RepID=A0A843XID6_COLES|nr:hypothetical protein [Colocasia esculenta]
MPVTAPAGGFSAVKTLERQHRVAMRTSGGLLSGLTACHACVSSKSLARVSFSCLPSSLPPTSHRMGCQNKLRHGHQQEHAICMPPKLGKS